MSYFIDTYLDIETIPTRNQSVIDEIIARINPPANYKKQETIDLWLANEGKKAAKELIHKTGLDGLYGSIACIGFAFQNSEVESVDCRDRTEKEMLEEFFLANFNDFEFGYRFIGHNISGFDLEFIRHRCIINQVKPPAALKAAFDAKPWDDYIADTMLMWSKQKRVSQDKLARALGLPGKGDFNGSMVAEAWFNGEHQKVVDYCKDDVAQNREIYKRLMFIHES